MELSLIPMARMSATVRKGRTKPVEVAVKTDRGAVCVFVRGPEKDALDDALAMEKDWPLRWMVETDRGRAALLLTRDNALSVSGLLKIGDWARS